MWNIIPAFGWAVSFLISVSLAIPFWFVWTICGIGESYFYFLPPVYHRIGFWASVGLFMVISILKVVLVPKLITISNSSSKEG